MLANKSVNKKNIALRNCRCGFKPLAVLPVLLACQLYAIWKYTVFGHVDISRPFIASVLVVFLALNRATRMPPKFNTSFTSVLILGLIFAAWVGFQALRLPQLVRAFTMFLVIRVDIAILS